MRSTNWFINTLNLPYKWHAENLDTKATKNKNRTKLFKLIGLFAFPMIFRGFQLFLNLIYSLSSFEQNFIPSKKIKNDKLLFPVPKDFFSHLFLWKFTFGRGLFSTSFDFRQWQAANLLKSWPKQEKNNQFLKKPTTKRIIKSQHEIFFLFPFPCVRC